jgi:hypothetical protein
MKFAPAVDQATISNVLNANPDNQWIRYRLTASTLPALFNQARSAAPNVYGRVIGAATQNLVDAAEANPTDPIVARLIPVTAIAALSAMLDGLSMSPDNWFVGEKSRSSIPGLTYRMIREASRRELSFALDSITAANDMVALMTALASIPQF